MAGIVKSAHWASPPGSRRFSIVPMSCPCLSPIHRPLCVEGSTQSGRVNLCPFFYGLRVQSGGMIADLRDTSGMLTWLGTDTDPGRTYQTLCLRKESSNTEAGAKLRD